ncbi:MAG: TRAP transporter small permease [Eubacteriales bacterium]
MLHKAVQVFNTVFDSIVTAFFILDIICIIIQVFARFVLHASVPFTEELSRYLLVGFLSLGIAMCARKGEHLGAFFIRDHWFRAQPYIFLINSIIMIGVTTCFAIGALQMMGMSAGKVATTMPWYPLSFLYFQFFIGMALADIYSVRDLVNTILIIQGKKEIVCSKSAPTKED